MTDRTFGVVRLVAYAVASSLVLAGAPFFQLPAAALRGNLEQPVGVERVAERLPTGPQNDAYLAEARREIATWCPETPIEIDTPAVRLDSGSSTVGKASSSITRAGSSYRWSTRIELRSGLSAGALRHAAIHECAHIVQFRTYVKGPAAMAELTAHAAAVYGKDGLEKQADCMAQAITGTVKYMYYATGCSTAQMSEATRLWDDYGSVYQDAVLTWRLKG